MKKNVERGIFSSGSRGGNFPEERSSTRKSRRKKEEQSKKEGDDRNPQKRRRGKLVTRYWKGTEILKGGKNRRNCGIHWGGSARERKGGFFEFSWGTRYLERTPGGLKKLGKAAQGRI